MKKLLEVKKEIGTLSKNSKNPFFKSKYLDLTSLLEAVEPLLQKHDLLLLQPISLSVVSTEIWDASTGERICVSNMQIPESITDPQKIGSAVTYLRRYTLKSLLAIAEADDDGNLAAKPSKPAADKINIDNAIKAGATLEAIKKHYKVSAELTKYFNDNKK